MKVSELIDRLIELNLPDAEVRVFDYEWSQFDDLHSEEVLFVPEFDNPPYPSRIQTLTDFVGIGVCTKDLDEVIADQYYPSRRQEYTIEDAVTLEEVEA